MVCTDEEVKATSLADFVQEIENQSHQKIANSFFRLKSLGLKSIRLHYISYWHATWEHQINLKDSNCLNDLLNEIISYR